MSANSDAYDVIQAALAAAEPSDLGDGRKVVTIPADGVAKVIEPIDEKYLDAPRRVSGSMKVLDTDGLAFLFDKHGLPESEVFADPVRFSVTAVLNADRGAADVAGFRDHRIELALVKTPEWLAWEGLSGRLVGQLEFAEHIEDNVAAIVRPTGAEMLELAQSFEASTKVDFKSATILGSGQRGLVFEETVAAKAGQRGQIEIPTTFELGLQPFEGSDRYKVTARFRYRIREGNLQIGYTLERPEAVLRNAFDDVRHAASEAVGRPIVLGTAPAPR